jgi:hypothetical protein
MAKLEVPVPAVAAAEAATPMAAVAAEPAAVAEDTARAPQVVAEASRCW